MNRFKDFATKAGLWTEDNASNGSTPAVASSPALIPQPLVTPLQVVQVGNADAAMVNNLKTSVLSASPTLGQFMQNVEVARGSFPNDETACMKAALAFTRVSKAELLKELEHPVAAALTQAKKSAEGGRKAARDSAVGSLEKELSATNSEAAEMESRIAELNQSITQKRAKVVQLQGMIRDAEADLQRQDNVVNASFAQVEQQIASLVQTFSKL